MELRVTDQTIRDYLTTAVSHSHMYFLSYVQTVVGTEPVLLRWRVCDFTYCATFPKLITGMRSFVTDRRTDRTGFIRPRPVSSKNVWVIFFRRSLYYVVKGGRAFLLYMRVCVKCDITPDYTGLFSFFLLRNNANFLSKICLSPPHVINQLDAVHYCPI